MTRETVVDSRQEILRTAARLFQQRGYDATSMNDVAAALKLSKGGLYHHFQSKDEILYEIMNHAMEITEERVLNPVRGIADQSKSGVGNPRSMMKTQRIARSRRNKAYVAEEAAHALFRLMRICAFGQPQHCWSMLGIHGPHQC